MNTVKTEDTPEYAVALVRDISEDDVVTQALEILERRLRKPGEAFQSPFTVKNYLSLYFAGLAHELFIMLLLDSQNRLISVSNMFRGTLTQTSVYPREVVKEALHFNAAAVILAHNHPSGFAEPSRADELLTEELKKALALVEVRVLDHFVVAGKDIVSFAERGLI